MHECKIDFTIYILLQPQTKSKIYKAQNKIVCCKIQIKLAHFIETIEKYSKRSGFFIKKEKQLQGRSIVVLQADKFIKGKKQRMKLQFKINNYIASIIDSWLYKISSMKKLRVIQFQGLAPSVFLGLYFADQGADVIFVARNEAPPVSMPFDKNILNRNKKCIFADFKNPRDFAILKELLKTTDVVIDPYRPGVLEKLKLGPKDLALINEKIILLRVSGYGQQGQNKLRPGHDANYMAVGGIFPLFNKQGQNQFPMNYMADFVAASLGITGVFAALRQREITGLGGVVDCSLTDGCTYFAQNLIEAAQQQQDFRVKTFKIGETQYIASGHNVQKLKKQEIVDLLKQKTYVRVGLNLQISKVVATEAFDVNVLINPFRKQQINNIIRAKGENTTEISQKYAPKL